MIFKKFIKAVGTGQKGNKDLTFDESYEVFKLILEGSLTPSQIGVFLIALRVKLETNDELKGAFEALNLFIKTEKIEDSMILGYSYDGKCENPYLFPLFENILSDFYKKNQDIKRLNLVICGDYMQPAKVGVTTKDIFSNIDKGQYVNYFDRIEFLNKLSLLTNLRNELCLRTAFNTVEKLLNPSLSEYAVTSAFHKPYVSKYLDIFKAYYKDLTVIRGSEGGVEVFKDSKYWQIIDGEIKEFSFSLKDFGVTYKTEYENLTLEDSLNLIKNPTNELIALAKFNVALYLLFSKRVSSLDEAWQRLN